MERNILSRLIRYKIERLLLRTLKKNNVFRVDMGRCVNPLGFSFDKEGWHCLVEYLRQVEKNPVVPISKSIIYLYHKTYQPQSMSDLVHAAGMMTSFDPGFFRYPWGNFKVDFHHSQPEKDRLTSRFCGPSVDEFIKKEAHQLIKLRDKIKHDGGYNPWEFPNTFIGGVFLKRRNGDYRFVVLQGNHRVSVMSYLGITRFVARFLPNHYLYIYEDGIDEWYYVRNGMCSREDAKKYFDSFFILNGRERAQSLYLI